jgi:epoxide hydrolase 4
MRHPQRVERLVVLNAPHPVRFLRGLRSLRQLRRSWYVLFFQLPWLPERLVRAEDLWGLRRTLRRARSGRAQLLLGFLEPMQRSAARTGES